jgi:hypothetical protein
MKKIFFIHFNETGLKEKIQSLRQAGYKVDYHFSKETVADLGDNLPVILVVCFDRLPSHGRRHAEWLWEAKKRQHIPIVFCGGTPEKILVVKEKLPKANFCSNEKLMTTLDKLK